MTSCHVSAPCPCDKALEPTHAFRRIHVALFLGCVGAVNGAARSIVNVCSVCSCFEQDKALGIFYPSALWWGEDQLQAFFFFGAES